MFESDGVPSAIRIVDVFVVPPLGEFPKEKTPTVMLNLYVAFKFLQRSEKNHTLHVKLVRPSGEAAYGADQPYTFEIDFSKYPEAPAGFNAQVQIPVIIKELGTHFLVTEVDGEEVSRAVFTLIQRESEQAPS
jgi:hypothetical protein